MFRVKRITLGLFIVAVVLVACSAPRSVAPPTVALPTVAPPTVALPTLASPIESSPLATPASEDEGRGSGQVATAAVQAASAELAGSLGTSEDAVEFVSAERRQWPDACLGLPAQDEVCTQAIVPGWRIVLRVQGEQYVLRVDEGGGVVRQEQPAPSAGQDPAMIARGAFAGVGGHTGLGMASVVRLSDGTAVLRLEEFSVTQGPDLYVYLVGGVAPTTSAEFGSILDLGVLQSSDGEQEYAIPEGADLGAYGGVVIYCLAYDEVFATASLSE